MIAVVGFVEWVRAILARSASAAGAQVETHLQIAYLTASPLRSGLVFLICFGEAGLAGTTTFGENG